MKAVGANIGRERVLIEGERRGVSHWYLVGGRKGDKAGEGRGGENVAVEGEKGGKDRPDDILCALKEMLKVFMGRNVPRKGRE